MNPKWKVHIVNNRLVFEDRDRFDEYLIPLEGKTMDLVIKKPVEPRSRKEEKYYHSVVKPMVAEEMSIEPEEAHEFLRGLLLRVEENHEKYGRYERVKSTTELNKQEYQEYWRRVIKWAALPTKDYGLGLDSGLGLYIPDPNECDYD